MSVEDLFAKNPGKNITGEEDSPAQLIDELRGRLAEAEEILQAISEHKVDAFIIGAGYNEQVYTLKGADHAYQIILEAINEGAATLGADGSIFYCNPAFTRLLHLSLEEIIGSSLITFVSEEDKPRYSQLMKQGSVEQSKGEVTLLSAAGISIPVLLSCSPLKLESIEGVCLVATDLTEQKRQIEEKRKAEEALAEVRQRLSQSQESERLLLARELHDGPLQEVIGMTFDLLLLAQTLQEADQLSKVHELNNSVQKTARHLRLMAQTLRPPVLAHLGLAAAVRAHIKQVQETRERPLLSFTISEEQWNVPEETALALLRIMQQAVQNALQHAQADHIHVILEYNNDWLRLEIKDDGRGFRKSYDRVEFARDGHLGVVGMAERAETIRGKFEVSSQPDQGTSISVLLPRPS